MAIGDCESLTRAVLAEFGEEACVEYNAPENIFQVKLTGYTMAFQPQFPVDVDAAVAQLRESMDRHMRRKQERS